MSEHVHWWCSSRNKSDFKIVLFTLLRKSNFFSERKSKDRHFKMDYKQVKKDTAQSTQPACTANVTTWNSQVQAINGMRTELKRKHSFPSTSTAVQKHFIKTCPHWTSTSNINIRKNRGKEGLCGVQYMGSFKCTHTYMRSSFRWPGGAHFSLTT
jgi:hypothetical protein